MKVIELFFEIAKFFKPKFHNKLTLLIVISGLMLIGKPFWENVVSSIFKNIMM